MVFQLVYLLFNHRTHVLDISKHLLIRKTEKADSMLFDLLLSHNIFYSRRGSVVACSIYLNRKPQLRTVEVENKMSDAVLSTELVSEHLAAFKAQPQYDFGTGAMGT